MRARWLVAAGIGATSVATAAFVACASGPGSDPLPGRAASAATTEPATPAVPAPQGSAADSRSRPDELEDAGSELAQAIAVARRCDEPRAAIRNHPDGGTIFNNAMTGEDAGSIDRMQGVLDALAGRADAFRCCFDHWLASHEAGQVQIMLQVALDPNGAVESATVDPARSSAGDEILSGCLAAVASETTFPPSPRGAPTLVEYPFDVVAAP